MIDISRYKFKDHTDKIIEVIINRSNATYNAVSLKINGILCKNYFYYDYLSSYIIIRKQIDEFIEELQNQINVPYIYLTDRDWHNIRIALDKKIFGL